MTTHVSVRIWSVIRYLSEEKKFRKKIEKMQHTRYVQYTFPYVLYRVILSLEVPKYFTI
jgi:hypothetical protein